MKSRFPTILMSFLLAAIASCSGDVRKADETAKEGDVSFKIASAERVDTNRLLLKIKPANTPLSASMLSVAENDSGATINVEDVAPSEDGKGFLVRIAPMAVTQNCRVKAAGAGDKTALDVQPADRFLNAFSSDKKLGLSMEGGVMTFRVFAPRAVKVTLALFAQPYEGEYDLPSYPGETDVEMTRAEDGVWESVLSNETRGKFYGYRVCGPKGAGEMFDPRVVVADPYSAALATRQIAPQHTLSVIAGASGYRWNSPDRWVTYDHRDLILYETHIRDLTMLSTDIPGRGTYDALTAENGTGGLSHLLELGVNAVEFLPLQEFGEIEAPYMVKSNGLVYNTWNPEGRNHWGYMTANYFAPESYYLKGRIAHGEWIGTDGAQTDAFRRVVDKLHSKKIAVMMDVVYNHVNNYDKSSLKYLDKKYYFVMKPNGDFDDPWSYGGQFNSTRPMTRRLIIDSVKYWMSEYRIDGFRFDLATVTDWETWKALIRETKALNPGVFLTCEPWGPGYGGKRDGGGYSPEGFAKIGMSVWNDKFRNHVRGAADASYGLSNGVVFGKASAEDMKNAVRGMPDTYLRPEFSVNYIESHDNNTFGDFLRLGDKDMKPEDETLPGDTLKKSKLTDLQLRQSKLAALYLLTAQGAVMLHEGQEFARMKTVVPPAEETWFPGDKPDWKKQKTNGQEIWMWGDRMWPMKDKKKAIYDKAAPWRIERDSYNKDNEGNWLNWKLREVNRPLFDYYKMLVRLRRGHPAFTRTPPAKIAFIDAGKDAQGKAPQAALGWLYDKALTGDLQSFTVLINAHPSAEAVFTLPAGKWKNALDPAAPETEGSIRVAAITGLVLYR